MFWNFRIFTYRSDSPQINRKLMSSIANLAYKLPHELLNNLRLRILGNEKMIEKSQSWDDTQPGAQPPFKNLDFANSKQKTSKNRYQNFFFLSSFTGLIHFVPNILSTIVDFDVKNDFYQIFATCSAQISPKKCPGFIEIWHI